MLTNNQEYVLSMLRNSFKTDNRKTVELTDVQNTAAAILCNGILPTVYHTLPDCLEAELHSDYCITLKQLILQNYEGKQVLNALSAAGMDCIALKGWEMQKLYPESFMRQMADLDILVRPYSFNRIKTVMEGLGFKVGSESSWKHDSFRKGEVHVEMHKRLTDDSRAIQKWEESMWDRAVPTEDTHVYRMTAEDYYIFHFVHLHKDFMNGSLGLRRIVDTWLLQKQNVDMDMVRNELQRFGLLTFHERMVKLSRAALGDEPIDDNSEILLSHAFTHGIYGSDVSYKAGRIAAMGKSIDSGKRNSAIAAVFLPYKRMKAQFPVLNRWPILLP